MSTTVPKKNDGKKLELKLLLLAILYVLIFLISLIVEDVFFIIIAVLTIDLVFTFVFTNWLFNRKVKKIDSKSQEIRIGISFIFSLMFLFVIDGLLMIAPYLILGLI